MSSPRPFCAIYQESRITPRSIRRAEERKPLKLARKAEQRQLSDAQVEANRANAQSSTGPTTAEGKAKISLNAVKTGLTGRTVLLPGDDVKACNAAAARVRRTFDPVGEEEEALAQSLIDTQWRLDRIPNSNPPSTRLQCGVSPITFMMSRTKARASR